MPQRYSCHTAVVLTSIGVVSVQVKLLKCLVDNIVVDISFNQMGGLITLNFLEEINNLIGNSNIFKRSIILVRLEQQHSPSGCVPAEGQHSMPAQHVSSCGQDSTAHLQLCSRAGMPARCSVAAGIQ